MAVVVALAALLCVGCANSGNGDLIVAGASSLTEALPALADDYRQAGGQLQVSFVFAGSQLLVAQALEGAPYDLVVTADPSTMEQLDREQAPDVPPERLAGNRLTIAVAQGNPRRIAGPEDLTDPDLVVVLAGEQVPAGAYTAEALARAGVAVEAASFESSVRAVLAKVAAGEADAGIVYETDVSAAAGVVAVEGLPEVETEYMVAQLADRPNSRAAQEFLEYLRSDRARMVLARLGFVP